MQRTCKDKCLSDLAYITYRSDICYPRIQLGTCMCTHCPKRYTCRRFDRGRRHTRPFLKHPKVIIIHRSAKFQALLNAVLALRAVKNKHLIIKVKYYFNIDFNKNLTSQHCFVINSNEAWLSYISDELVWQLIFSYPGAHVHVYLLTPSTHVPPCKHGSGVQSSISARLVCKND